MIQLSEKSYWRLLIYSGRAIILVAIVLIFLVNKNDKIPVKQKENTRWGLYGFIIVGLFVAGRGAGKRQRAADQLYYETIKDTYSNSDMSQALMLFIEHKCGIDKSDIKLESRIEKDLGITGDDAVELLVEFGEVFKVDLSNFMAADYFDAEGHNWLCPGYSPNKKILTVAHLVKGVNNGKLDENVING